MKHTKFRHTTPGFRLVLVTKHKPQPTSELFDPTYPGAHLLLDWRHFVAPLWISPHLALYAFSKAFLSKPDVPSPEPNEPQPYPVLTRRRVRQQQQRSADMSSRSMRASRFGSSGAHRSSVDGGFRSAKVETAGRESAHAGSPRSRERLVIFSTPKRGLPVCLGLVLSGAQIMWCFVSFVYLRYLTE